MNAQTNKTGIAKEFANFQLLMRSIPSWTVALFTVSVVSMNLLANKEIHTGVPWLALDAGLTMSWMSFLAMDLITKRFGPKAAIQVSMFAVGVNMLMCVLLNLVTRLPGNWSAYYMFNNTEVNLALDATFGGTWYVVFGSTVAFLSSSIVNALVNAGIGNKLSNASFKDFAIRSYVSTLFAQYVDNLVFAFVVSHTFFGWSVLQCLTCAATGCLMELLCEVVFSPVGYRVSKQWEVDQVGSEYVNRRGV